MNDNIVKLVFRCVSTGSGWADLKKRAAESIKDMGHLTGAMKAVGTYAGAMGGMLGRALGAFAMGNVWGLATEGIHFLVEKLGLFKDRSEEAKKKADELREAIERYHEAILKGTEKSLADIDKETAKRNAQLDITNRMIKAELELQRARAVASGDVGKAESIGREIERRGNEATMEKAVVGEKEAERKYKAAEDGVDAAKKARKDAIDDLGKAKKALEEASKPITITVQSTAGAYSHTKYKDTSAEKAAVAAAKERLEMAEKTLETARRTAAEERARHLQAKNEVKALAAEQRAAEEKAKAEKAASDRKTDEQNRKDQAAHMASILNAGTQADFDSRFRNADVDGKIEMLKGVEADELAEMRAAEKEVAQEMDLDVSNRNQERLTSARARAEKAQTAMIAARTKREELLQEKAKKQEEADKKEEDRLKRKAVNALKDKADATREQIQKEKTAHEETLRKLEEARAAVPATIDVLGNAAGMDQAGELRGKRQKDITDRRFNERFAKLLTSGKIQKDANGNWKIDGRASNLDKAVLDRLNANEKVKRAEAQALKERQRLEKMEGYLKTISETIKTATEI